MTNRMNRGIGGGCAAAAALVVLSLSTSASARTYQVPNYAPDGLHVDRVCSLREAVDAANLRTAVGACPAGDLTNEIVITGDPARSVELSVAEHIEIKSNLVIRAAPGPGFHQAIIGNNTTFVVRAGGVLALQNLRLSGFDITPIHVEKALIPGRGLVRGVLNATDVEISGNHGPNAIYQSMGIINAGGEVFLNVVKISHNDGAIKGGGIINQSGILTVWRSAIYDNTVSQYGGAIHNVGSGAIATISQSTLSGNSARLAGGGIYNGSGATVELAWTTITGNESEGKGAGIFNDTGGTVRVGTSIVAGNLLNGSLIDCEGVLTSNGRNLLQNCPGTESAIGDIRNMSANLSALTFPAAGDPLWSLAPWHAPNFGSPVINTIPSGTGTCLTATKDQIFKSRLVGGRCDMGAIERQ